MYELLERMSFQEYVLWAEYFDQRPYGWREDNRTYNIMRASGNVKSSAEDIFPSIAHMKKKQAEKKPVPGPGTLLFEKLLNAKGGDKFTLLENMK